MPDPPVASLKALESRTYKLVNAHRIARGLSPLAYDARIAAVARRHSEDMADGRVPAGHEGFEARQRNLSKMIPLKGIAENVGMNDYPPSRTVRATMTGWLGSRGHRENIEGRFDLTGVGIVRDARGAYYYTQIFVKLMAVASVAEEQPRCEPTQADVEGPFYKPGAPERTSTGEGLVVSGRLLGSPDCRPLSGGRIEWWHADGSGKYDDAHRGSLNVNADGSYKYTTDFPGKYPWRSLHIHFKAFAAGYKPLTTQLYLRGGEKQVVFDIVLAPMK